MSHKTKKLRSDISTNSDIIALKLSLDKWKSQRKFSNQKISLEIQEEFKKLGSKYPSRLLAEALSISYSTIRKWRVDKEKNKITLPMKKTKTMGKMTPTMSNPNKSAHKLNFIETSPFSSTSAIGRDEKLDLESLNSESYNHGHFGFKLEIRRADGVSLIINENSSLRTSVLAEFFEKELVC